MLGATLRVGSNLSISHSFPDAKVDSKTTPRLSAPPTAAGRPDYFQAFEDVEPPELPALSEMRMYIWQLCASFTIGLGAWYLHWRWAESLNPNAFWFSTIVALAETAMFLGTLLYFFDTWSEGDTPTVKTSAGLNGICMDVPATVDVFVATYNEDTAVLRATLQDAQAVRVPPGWEMEIHLLDDGDRPEVFNLARQFGVNYIARDDNRGFKAGNLRNALFRTDGEFVVICDADTRLFPGFLENTLGYFLDPDVAWVQTPHWFYDVPDGRPWRTVLPSWATPVSSLLAWVTGNERQGSDPYLCGSMLFFDVIQRRRNRNNASFCCGAGSIHRREPLFEDALNQHQADRVKPDCSRHLLPALTPLQPFRFHVSEDIFTSINLHGAADRQWKSVYHPNIESKMLSPWSMDAWASQKLKYAGGTIDLMINANPLWNRHMPWRVKLHYAATFWSYLSSIALLVLLLAPIVTLFTGIAPISAYSTAFFLHLLPLLLANELALAVGSKGQDGHQGRVLSLATLPITLRAFWLVLSGRAIRFRPTPKTPASGDALRFVWPQLALLALIGAAAAYGFWAHLMGSRPHTASLLIVNYFWLGWSALAMGIAIKAAFWRPSLSGKNALLAHSSAKEGA